MQHDIPVETLGVMGEAMAHAVGACVHCGFCLPACPTYSVLGEEMDSPRGRIVLMKSVLEGDVELEDALPYIDRCLGCLGCVTACPSGVSYGELIMPFRAYAQERRSRPLSARVTRRLVLETLPYPGRFRLAALSGNMVRPVQGLLPAQLRAMINLLPESLPAGSSLPAVFPAQGVRRGRVALLAGCVQQGLAPEINWATLRVLARNGIEVVIPEGQGCCGALALHTGETELARQQALHNMQLLSIDVDAILTNAAGCGSGMKEYPLLFKGTRWEKQAQEFAARVQDISVFLDNLGLETPPPLAGANAGRLPRCLPPGARPGGHRRPAPPAFRHPQSEPGEFPRGRSMLRLGRHVQPRAARYRSPPGRAQGAATSSAAGRLSSLPGTSVVWCNCATT